MDMLNTRPSLSGAIIALSDSDSMFRSTLISGLISLFTLASVYAQDYGVPLSWRKFTNSRLLAERISISQNAINAFLPQVDSSTGQINGIGFWQAGNVWGVLANQDRLAGTTGNQAAVISNMNTAFGLYANYDQFGFNDDAMWWATSAFYASRAYKDQNMLSHAEAVWNRVSAFQVTPAQASAGSIPGKSFAIQSTCEGHSMAGGVFWRPTSDDQAINSVTTGLFLTLSAFLAETTGDAKYTNAAVAAANWMESLQINSANLILDTVNAADCSRSPSTWIFTYNTGKYIEGLSVLAAVTGDSSWTALMNNILVAGVKSGPWQGSDGIITEGASPASNNDAVGFKAIYIRGLHEAYERSPGNSALQILLHSYFDVQYNALLDLAATGDTYSSDWHGPPQAFTSWGQLAAIDVLTANINTNSP
ncbi:endo-1,6-alpha-mannosidase [Mycena floridula]|nr:endo-1,6-alpha-mannosidase [Mycena floridula]